MPKTLENRKHFKKHLPIIEICKIRPILGKKCFSFVSEKIIVILFLNC